MTTLGFVFPPSLKYIFDNTASERMNSIPPTAVRIHCFAKELLSIATALTAKVMNRKKV